MNLYTFSQVIVWLAGNITYFFVIPILLLYFYMMFSDQKKDKKWILLFSLINIISPMFIEHMAIILILSNIFFISYSYYKNKKLDKTLIVYLILSIISTLTMFLSPGTKLRNGMENLEFNQLSFFGKIIYNIPNFIFYTYISNYSLLPILMLSSYYLVKNTIQRKEIRILHYLFYLFPIFTIIGSLASFLGSNFFHLFSDSNHLLNIIYYILFTIDLIILFLIYTYQKKDIKPLFFFGIGLFSNGVMMLSPTWGYRTGFSTYFFYSIASFLIIDQYISYKKIYSYLLSFLIACFILFFTILYISVHLQYKENYNLIKEGITNHSKTISIYEYPAFVNCNINPSNEYHLNKFKEYYGIDKDTEVILLKNKWKYKLIYQK